MALNPQDENISTEELQQEANNGASDERIAEILSQLVVRTIKEWQNPGWFTEWVSTTSKKEAEKFLQDTLDTLLELELFEFCKDVELLKGQVEIFHSMNKKNASTKR
jgi:uncharacterized membrane-anchored protein YjiN (DUF445 family)